MKCRCNFKVIGPLDTICESDISFNLSRVFRNSSWVCFSWFDFFT